MRLLTRRFRRTAPRYVQPEWALRTVRGINMEIAQVVSDGTWKVWCNPSLASDDCGLKFRYDTAHEAIAAIKAHDCAAALEEFYAS